MSRTTLLKMGTRLLADDDHDHDEHAGENKGEHDDHDDHEGHDHHDHEGEHDDHEEGISVNAFKWIMLVCMLLCVGLGILPKVWGACGRNEQALSFLNCFSAGIFMAMSLVHMMPEAAEIYGMWAKKEAIERPFPLPYVCYFLGYFLILCIDRVAARAYHLGHDHNKDP